jgi:hypothetical protein
MKLILQCVKNNRFGAIEQDLHMISTGYYRFFEVQNCKNNHLPQHLRNSAINFAKLNFTLCQGIASLAMTMEEGGCFGLRPRNDNGRSQREEGTSSDWLRQSLLVPSLYLC